MASAVTTKPNKEIVTRFAEEVVNKGDYELLDGLVADDIVDHTPLGEDRGREAVLDTTKYLRAAFPDFPVTPLEIVAEGDTFAVSSIESLDCVVIGALRANERTLWPAKLPSFPCTTIQIG